MNYKNYLSVIKFDQENYERLKYLFNVRQIERKFQEKEIEGLREYKIFEFQTPEESSENFLQWLADNTMISDNPNFSKVIEMFMGMALGFKKIKPPEQKANIFNPPNIYLLAERDLNKNENKN